MVRTGNFGEAEKHYIKALNVARNTSTKDTIEALVGTLELYNMRVTIIRNLTKY